MNASWERGLTSVVVTDNAGTPLGRSELQGIRRGGRRADGHAKAQDKTAAEEVGVGPGSGLDGGADHDENGACHHADAATEAIADGAREEGANHVADGVNHKDAGLVRIRAREKFSRVVCVLTCQWQIRAHCGESISDTAAWR